MNDDEENNLDYLSLRVFFCVVMYAKLFNLISSDCVCLFFFVIFFV